jgi:serine protease Do
MGNSGGALVDAEGRLVGINTAILSRTGGNQGIGFAVPINLASYVMNNIIEHGRVVRGYMGVNIQDIDPSLAEKFELKERQGALVADVTPDSPAEDAGLKNGDVVLEFNGKPVKDSRNLKLQVAQIAPGKEVPVKISRDGSVKELKVKLKEFPQDKMLAKGKTAPGESGDVTDGITVDDLTPAARQQFNIPGNIKGALVVDVEPDSPGYEAGLRPGDVILEMNRKSVKSSEDAVALSEGLKDDVLLRVWSRGGSRFVVLKKTDKVS